MAESRLVEFNSPCSHRPKASRISQTVTAKSMSMRRPSSGGRSTGCHHDQNRPSNPSDRRSVDPSAFFTTSYPDQKQTSLNLSLSCLRALVVSLHCNSSLSLSLRHSPPPRIPFSRAGSHLTTICRTAEPNKTRKKKETDERVLDWVRGRCQSL